MLLGRLPAGHQGGVDHNAIEPWGEWAVGVELFYAVIHRYEAIRDEVFGALPVLEKHVCGAKGLHLVKGDKGCKARYVPLLDLGYGFAFLAMHAVCLLAGHLQVLCIWARNGLIDFPSARRAIGLLCFGEHNGIPQAVRSGDTGIAA